MKKTRLLSVCLTLALLLALFPAQALAAETGPDGEAAETPALEEPAPEESAPAEEPAPEESAPAEEPAPGESAPAEEPAPEESVPAEEPAPEEAPAPEEIQPEETELVAELAEDDPVLNVGDTIIRDGYLFHRYDWGTLKIEEATGTLVKASVPVSNLRDMVINEAIDGHPIRALGEGVFKGWPLTDIWLPDSIQTIGKEAFRECTSLSNVKLNDGLITIGESAFSNCTNLWSVSIPQTVKTIGKSVFHYCKSLQSVTLQEGLEQIGESAFYNADLRAVEVPESVRSIGGSAFANNTNLKSAKLPTAVQEFGAAIFSGCLGLSGTVRIPDGVTSIGNDMFYECRNLETVLYPDTITSIGESAFFSCGSLKDFQLPRNLTSIGRFAFSYCGRLTSITIPAGVTSLVTDTFYGGGFTTFKIHAGVTSIANCAITGSPLKDIYYGGTEEQWRALISSYQIKDTIHDATMHYGWTEEEVLYRLASYQQAVYLRFNPVTQTILGCQGTVDGYLSIPSAIQDIPVLAIADGAFRENKITSLSISGSVIHIGAGAFQSCEALTKVSIYNDHSGYSISIGDSAFDSCAKLETLTSERAISSVGDYAFQYCSALKNTTRISKYPLLFAPGLQRIGAGAFRNCLALDSIRFPKTLTSIGSGAFDGAPIPTVFYDGSRADWENFDCGDNDSVFLGKHFIYNFDSKGQTFFRDDGDGVIFCLDGDTLLGVLGDCAEDITIPRQQYNGTQITALGEYAFSGCDQITSVNLNRVLVIGDRAFSGCTGLTSVTSTDYNYITSIGDGAFSYCYSLTEFTLPQGLTRIGKELFAECTRLASVTIPDSVTSIGGEAFRNTNLQNVTLPKGLRELGNGVFKDCSRLSAVYFQGTQAEWDALVGNRTDVLPQSAILYCLGLTELKAEGGEVHFDPSTRTITGADKTVTVVQIPEQINGMPVEYIGKEAFADCTALTRIDLPYSLKEIGERAFSGCTMLAQGGVAADYLIIPHNVSSIGSGAFSGCTSLKTVSLPDGLTKIPSSLFWCCTALSRVYLPDNVTEIGGLAFYHCSSLEQIRIPNQVTEISGDAFSGCQRLKTVTFAENSSLTTLNYRVFENCTSLERIELPDTVRHLYGITFSGCSNLVSARLPAEVDDFGMFVFEKCEHLESIQIPRGITAIESSSFSSCRKLTSVTVPEGVTTIGRNAFQYCPLVSVLLPASLTSIGESAFTNTIMEDIYFGGTRAQWERVEIASSNSGLLRNPNLRIHCADDSGEGPIVGTCGGQLSWALEDGAILIIRGVGPMTDYASGDAAPWAYARETIRTVLVEPGVSSLGSYAFAGCGALRQISLPESLTSVGENAFLGCDQLSGVNYGGSQSNWAQMEPAIAAELPEVDVQTGGQVTATRKEDGTIRVVGAGSWLTVKTDENEKVKKVFAARVSESGQLTGFTDGKLEAGVVTLTDGTVFPAGEEGPELRLFLLNGSASPLCPKLTVS